MTTKIQQELNDGESCAKLGAMYYKGKGVKQNYSKAVEYLKEACNQGDGRSCSNVGVMYRKGEGVEQSDTKAAKYFIEGLDLGK